jgi:type VI secretion system protein ImpB
MQQDIGRKRKPRVHITYDVETENGNITKALPFVVGVMGDFSGNPTTKLMPLKQRKFIQIDRENFNEVMKKLTPGVTVKVDNTMKADGTEMSVSLNFDSMEDFEPGNVVNRVEPLKKLLDSRNRLRDLLAKIDRSEALESLLEQVLNNDDDFKQLASELGANNEGGVA